eukprot:gnl/MRDRNA2_/MRDRNA2_93881_c0_seq1.p1 gnl/MRDRNA2_/MRDRNA2_93881_c0~~gnl/MRDRNA2_/MRDRNA2_93881_c0_seq1.p1  ORF type:complete len:283 (+),score=49.62 gnl/MRDRNA2_/MRDRNA2_93881_c0_seq1:81-929(+)
MCNSGVPIDVYHNGYLHKQAIKQQFTEDIRHVIHGGGSASGPTGRTGSQVRSSSLSAGASLALGSRLQARAESMDAAARNKARANTSTCPFDNHEQFQRREPSLPPTSSLQASSALLNPEDRQEHTKLIQQVKEQGRYNRDAGQKVGAPAPFDTPETQDHFSSGSRGRMGRPPCLPGSQSSVGVFAEGRAEALKNRKQNGQATENLISGEYLNYREENIGKRKTQMSQSAPEFIQPTGPAQMKMQFDGVSIAGADQSRMAYYNASTMREEARVRNNQSRLFN